MIVGDFAEDYEVTVPKQITVWGKPSSQNVEIFFESLTSISTSPGLL